MNRGAWFWKLAVAWALVIFGLSSIPGASFPASKIFSYDKLAHAGVYAVLGAFCFLALRTRNASKGTGVLIAMSGVAATIYGCTDEIHQLFVAGRSADPRDVMADAVGGFTGAFVASMLVAAADRRSTPPIAAPSVPPPNSNRAS
ncbi:MAG: VanZ family protein [Polyangiaceae bacterium]